MFLVPVLSIFIVIDLCIALPSDTILGRRDAECQNATAVAHDSTCWATLGYNTWFDTWKGLCPGPLGCDCDVHKPWSDCALNQYQTALGDPVKSTISCTDVTRSDLCKIPSVDWAKLSENQLATGYASTAIGNLYHFIHGWYMAITQSPTPPAVLEVLFDRVTSPANTSISRTDVHVAPYLANLMTSYSSNDTFIKSFVDVMIQVVSEDTVIDAGAMNIQAIQNVLGQALVKTLNASLSAWNTPYFDSLAKNGALLDTAKFGKPPQLNDSLSQASPNQPFDITGMPGDLALNNSGRDLLSHDVMEKLNFTIVHCDSNDIGGLADHVADLLDAIHHNLFLVMHETTKGKHSQYGFYQLWHTMKWLPIRRIYEKIYNSDPVSGPFAAYPSLTSRRPVFMCLQPHNRDTWALYNVCHDEIRLRAFRDPANPNLVGLCPSFWALPANPPRAFCPYKGRITATFIGTALQLNQQSILIHQLVKMYLGQDNILDPERFNLLDSMELDPDDAYKNPSTWAYWYSSVVGCTPLSWNDPEL